MAEDDRAEVGKANGRGEPFDFDKAGTSVADSDNDFGTADVSMDGTLKMANNLNMVCRAVWSCSPVTMRSK